MHTATLWSFRGSEVRGSAGPSLECWASVCPQSRRLCLGQRAREPEEQEQGAEVGRLQAIPPGITGNQPDCRNCLWTEPSRRSRRRGGDSSKLSRLLSLLADRGYGSPRHKKSRRRKERGALIQVYARERRPSAQHDIQMRVRSSARAYPDIARDDMLKTKGKSNSA